MVSYRRPFGPAARLLLVVTAVLLAVGLGVAIGLAGNGDSDQSQTGSLVPPTPVVYLPIAVFNQSADLEMVFTAAPGLAGPNDVNFYLRDVNGDDRPYTAMSARFSYLDGGRAVDEQRPVQLHEGHWPLDKYDLSLAGRWRIDAAVSRDGLPDAHFIFEMQLPHR